MPGIKRNQALRAAQRAKIAELRLKSIPVSQIAKTTRLSDSTVNRELKLLAVEWRKEAGQSIDAHRQRELQKLDLIEQKAWAEYERSRRNYSKEVTERFKFPGKGIEGADLNTDPTVIKRESGGRIGEAKFLQIALNAHERRAKILGLDAPTKVAPTDPDGNNPYDPKKISDAELDARILELAAKFGMKPV